MHSDRSQHRKKAKILKLDDQMWHKSEFDKRFTNIENHGGK